MKTAKQLLSFLLVLALVLTGMPMSAHAAQVVVSNKDVSNSWTGDLDWTLYSDGLLKISGTGDMTYCDIESSVPWYDYRDQIRRVTIDDGISSITNFAFKNCFNLESIEIPDTVTAIEASAFYGCGRLLEVELPAGVTSIGNYAFYMCDNLRRIDFGPALKKIGDYAFNMCRSLRVVIIPASVTDIGSWCFQACDSLGIFQFLGKPPAFSSNMFPGSVTCWYPAEYPVWEGPAAAMTNVTWKPFSPGDSIFPAEPAPADSAPEAPVSSGGETVTGSCGGLNWTLYGTGLMTISGIGSVANTCPWEEYAQQIKAVVMEEGVTAVEDEAFTGLENLAYVSVPASVTRIGDFAFAWNYSLKTVVFGGRAVKMGYRVFDDISLTCYYPAGGWSYLDRLEYGSMYMTWRPYSGVTLPDAEPDPTEPAPTEPAPPAQELVDSGTCGQNVTWAMHPDGTLVISGTGPMEDYPNDYPAWNDYADLLRKVVIEEGVTHVGDYAFWGYRGIEEVVLPESLRTIGGVAFGYCEGLREITIPAGVQEVKDYAFAECTKLEMITFRGDAPVFGEDVFTNVDAMAAHPFGNATWNDDNRLDHGGWLSWLVEGTPNSLRLQYAPVATSCVVGESIDLYGIWVEADYGNGKTVQLKRGALTLESADTSTVGVSSAVVSYMGLTVEFPIYVHAGRKNVELDPELWPESPHNYGSGMNDSQYISYDGADSLSLTFSRLTYLEEGYDFLYVFDAYDHMVARFTGGEAAGETVVVPGSTAQIRLVTDSSSNEYGYALTAATASVVEHVGDTAEGRKPDCYTDGVTAGIICDICGQGSGGQVIPALGHNWGHWLPMTNSDGMYRTCGRCGDYDYLDVEKCFLYPGDSEYDELSMDEIRALYDTVDWEMEAEYAVQPVVTAPYAPGRLTDACLDNLTAQVNFFRRLAKVDSVNWSEDLVELAQAGSLVNAVNGVLSHYPSQPADMPQDLYDLGSTGTSRSNLAWGTHMLLMDSVPAYLDDSDASNIDRVGHRRWLLNPRMGVLGFGNTSLSNRSHYHAMYVFDESNRSHTNADFTAYPGGNRIYPSELFASHVAWSVQLNPNSFRIPNPDEVRVYLVRESDGKQWSFSNQASDSEAGFFNVETNGYGDCYSVIFRPADVSGYEGVYNVLITGLRTKDNETACIEYTVDFQYMNEPEHEHTPETRDAVTPSCTENGYTGDTYCRDCGELLEYGHSLAALGHQYDQGVCVYCGHQEVLKGDVNGDGRVDSDDAIHLLYHTLFGDLYPISQDCDFDGSGAVDSDDAIHLLYHTLFGDGLYPLS